MIIRKERPEDYNKVFVVVKSAFKTAKHSDKTEQNLVVSLRNSNAYIPELSLVAEVNDEIVGHILFTKINISNQEEIALAPLAVLPEYQRQGIGKALIKKGHEIAKKLGYNYCVVLGDENYYPLSGYVPASQYGILAPFDVPDANFMAIKLCENANTITGTVKYAKEFGIN